MSGGPDWVITPGADAVLELEPIGPAPGVTAALLVRPRALVDSIFGARVRIRAAGLQLEVPGTETAKWAFGIGRYEVWLSGPQKAVTLHASGRVLLDRR